MNRIIRILTVFTIAVWPGLSSAYMEVLTRSYEVGVEEVTLPAHTAGRVVIRPCGDCESIVLRVSADTTYHVGTDTKDEITGVPLAVLKDAVDDGLGTLVLVAVYPDTDEVARITLDTGE